MSVTRLAAGLVGCAALAALAGGCLHDSSETAATDLTITVNRGLGSQWGETVYRATRTFEVLGH
jgi:hypothetical protein